MKKLGIQMSLMLVVTAFICPGYAQSPHVSAEPSDTPKQVMMGKCIQAEKSNTIQISDASDCKSKQSEKEKSQQG